MGTRKAFGPITAVLAAGFTAATLLAGPPSTATTHSASTPAAVPLIGARAVKLATPSMILLTPTADPMTAQTISWSSAAAAKAFVEFREIVDGKPAKQRQTVLGVRRARTSARYTGTTQPRYVATLRGLRPDTAYQYRIVSAAARSGWATFRTAAKADDDWSLLALGDGQKDNAGVGRVVATRAFAADPAAELVVSTGDVVNKPHNFVEWRDFFRLMGTTARTRNWLVAIGNHEQCLLTACESGDAQAYRSYFKWPRNGFPGQGATWFYTDYQGVRFVVLDVFGADIDAQVKFLDEALTDNPQKWSVIVMHASPFAGTPVRRNPVVAEKILPIITKHNVDLVLTGHDHSYARGYLIPGGTMFAISDSGPKFYPSSDEDWVDQGATQVVAAAKTSTFQQIRFVGNDLRYRAVIAYKAKGSTTHLAVGDTLDEFTITKRADGSKTIN